MFKLESENLEFGIFACWVTPLLISHLIKQLIFTVFHRKSKRSDSFWCHSLKHQTFLLSLSNCYRFLQQLWSVLSCRVVSIAARFRESAGKPFFFLPLWCVFLYLFHSPPSFLFLHAHVRSPGAAELRREKSIARCIAIAGRSARRAQKSLLEIL